ncbi:Olfactory receptor 7A17 [Heterocephalus glaber]|uniref:Olfactory receptor 7A17 n=1 Tax=Heterocephalus glaber TaxID=10181 RepID=G5C8T2_HETGA|nr:Olfactory receptor 7A17 [Heterocephalus glaber]
MQRVLRMMMDEEFSRSTVSLSSGVTCILVAMMEGNKVHNFSHVDCEPVVYESMLTEHLVLRNLLIILAVISDSHVHIPTYFFLSNRSFTDTCFISNMVSKMIVDILTQSRVTSYVDCLTQTSLFSCMDDMLLVMMAHDRNVAVASVMYTAVTPMLNPFIYSLWKRDMKSALQSLHRRTV